MAINWEESVYSDNPEQIHYDAKTTIPGVNYFFLGNGYIEAVVQVNLASAGSPAGLLLMQPEKFGPKSAALTFCTENGLQSTIIKIESGKEPFTLNPHLMKAEWTKLHEIPAVELTWKDSQVSVKELFYCFNREKPELIRKVHIRNITGEKKDFRISTGIINKIIEKEFTLKKEEDVTLFLKYEICKTGSQYIAEITFCEKPVITDQAVEFWNNTPECNFFSPLLNSIYTSSRNQLQAVISHEGFMDASIWQYNLEWSRDQAMAVMGLVMAGQFEFAGTMLERLFDKFVSDEGDTVDSGRRRPYETVELDQNGQLLLALKIYVDWTGDKKIVSKLWKKIKVLADYPLQDVFVHPESGLLHNCREQWERSDHHGFLDGFELSFQMYVSIGLFCAAEFAGILNKKKQAEEWEILAGKIKTAMLYDEKYKLVENGVIIKRKGPYGEIQDTVTPPDYKIIPPGVPLSNKDIPHYVNPDVSSVYPVMWEMIDPQSELALKTLDEVEKLWNQNWDFGGYARYNINSEPDSPGPWPFATMQIARAYYEAGNYEKVWRVLNWLGTVPGSIAGTHFEFYGPRPIPPCPQVGIAGWSWAENLMFFIHHMLGIRPGNDELIIRPGLLTGMQNMTASVRIRNFRLHLSVLSAPGEKGYSINGEFFETDKKVIKVRMPEEDIFIEVFE